MYLFWLMFNLVCCCTILSDGSTPSFISVNMAQVDKNVQLIQYEFLKASGIKKIIVGVSVALSAIVVYKLLTKNNKDIDNERMNMYPIGLTPGLFRRDQEMLNVQKSLDQLKHDVALIIRHEGALNTFLQDKGYSVTTPLTWMQSLRSWVYWCGNLMMISFMNTVASTSMTPFIKYFKAFDEGVDNRLNDWFPEKTMRWYLANRVSLPILFEHMEKCFKSFTNQSSVYALKESMVVWEMLVVHIERILAFIRYQSFEFDSLHKKRAEQILQRIYDAVDTASIRFNQCLRSDLNNYYEALSEMRTLIDDQLYAFIDIETVR